MTYPKFKIKIINGIWSVAPENYDKSWEYWHFWNEAWKFCVKLNKIKWGLK